MIARRLSILALSLVLWSSPGVAGRQSFHTRFFFSLTGAKSYWTDAAATDSFLGSAGGWSCTAGAIELSELHTGSIFKRAEIKCVDRNGSGATVVTSCNVADQDSGNQDVELQMKNTQPIHVALSCYTRRE